VRKKREGEQERGKVEGGSGGGGMEEGGREKGIEVWGEESLEREVSEVVVGGSKSEVQCCSRERERARKREREREIGNAPHVPHTYTHPAAHRDVHTYARVRTYTHVPTSLE